MLRRAPWSERLDDDKTPATAGTREREDTRPVGRIGAIGVGRGCASGEQHANAGDVGGAIAVSQEAVMTNAVLALGKHVDEEAPDELVRLQRHGLVAAGPIDPVAAITTPVSAPHGNARNLSRSDLVPWHNPDLQRPLELGPIMATLPTFGAECLLIAAFQTWR